MPDISMCQNKQCPRRFNCYRFMAKPSGPGQAYADFKYKIGSQCGDFMPIWKK